MKKLSLLILLFVLLVSCAPALTSAPISIVTNTPSQTNKFTPKPIATITPVSKNNVADYEVTPVRYIISEVRPINETVKADGIEMRWEKIQFLATRSIQNEKPSLSAEVYICFEKPSIDGVDMWIISSSKLLIQNANAEMDSYILIYDSERSNLFEDISPTWQPIGKKKDCIRATYLFESSNGIVWQLAEGIDITTKLSLIISGLKGFNTPNNSLYGPWIFDTVINP